MMGRGGGEVQEKAWWREKGEYNGCRERPTQILLPHPFGEPQMGEVIERDRERQREGARKSVREGKKSRGACREKKKVERIR